MNLFFNFNCMSHFCTLVIGEDVEGQLAPYDESEDVEEYLHGEVPREDIELFLESYNAVERDFDKLYKEKGEAWNNNSWGKNEEGIWQKYSTYNPESKWDWWVEGGRWKDSLKLKKENKEGKLFVDSAYKKDLDEDSLKTFLSYTYVQNGEWFEKGEMGWFGMSSETEQESKEWDKAFYEKVIKPLPEDTLLTVVDCHI